MRATEFLNEIGTLDRYDYSGGSAYLALGIDKLVQMLEPGGSKLLPGGSGFRYSIKPNHRGSGYDIWIIDPVFSSKTQEAIGKLMVEKISRFSRFPIPNAYKVDVITTHERYRGRNLAKALYGLVLLPPPVGLGGILLAGSEQTPGGQRNWLSLAQIPGVEVTGYIKITAYDLVDDQIDEILGHMGAVYFGKTKLPGGRLAHFFEFPITAGNKKLANLKGTENFSVYDPKRAQTGLMARYTG